MIGKKISHYSVSEKLGAGGMGEVYRAGDAKLGRDVALKVLPSRFADDAQRMGRLTREAQLLASLNHPNIASIYGLEESEGIRCLVLELVEGPTLAERIAEGAIPLEEALNIAKQIAEALESAHEKGIIHRDLKPANVKVTPEGIVKVLDFGLAKALDTPETDEEIANSPTLSAMATQAGVILGTAAYMSPEQARGQPVDKRADVWSFGAVLYEMLTGKRAFTGETASDTLAAVLRAEVEWDALPADTPATIHKLLRRCLDKDRKRRLQAIGEARIALEEYLADPAATSMVMSAASTAHEPIWRRALPWALAGVLAVAAGFLGWNLKPDPVERPVRKFPLATESVGLGIEISPDGQNIAYKSKERLWIRQLDQLTPREVPGSEESIILCWSPDSQTLAYAIQDKIWKFSLAGGEPTQIANMLENFHFVGKGAWQPNGRILFTTGGPQHPGLFAVSSRGGDPVLVNEIDQESESDFHDVSALPAGRGVLLVVHRKESYDTLAVWDGETRKTILQIDGERLFSPVYSPTGHILFQRSQATAGIWALPFSLETLEATGESFLAVPGAQQPSVSPDGTLVYIDQAGPAGKTQLVRVNRKGTVEGMIGEPLAYFPFPALSPEGKSLAVSISEGDVADIWIYDLERGTRTRLTFEPEMNILPSWTPQEDRIVFTQGNPGSPTNEIFILQADGTGKPRVLATGLAGGISPDGKYLVYSALGQENKTSVDLWALSLEEEAKPKPLVESPGDQSWGKVSPDGRYVAYQSDESKKFEIYLGRFPEGEGKWQVSVTGGYWPLWNREGNELFYIDEKNIMAVDVKTHPRLTLGKPQKLFSWEPSGLPLPPGWPEPFNVTPDGQQFILLQKIEEEAAPSRLIVVENWFEEFKNKP